MGVKGFSGVAPVGCCDVEWAENGLSSIVSATEVDPDKHLVGRLYYPTAQRGLDSQPSSSWLSSFREAKGYASFLFYTAVAWQQWTLRPLIGLGLWLFGRIAHVSIRKDGAFSSPAAAADDATKQDPKYPVVVFSHGIGGTRTTYSILCGELASQGFVVLAIEHADGTASCVHCAGQGGWRNYSGMGKGEVQHGKVAFRVREVMTAIRLLESLNAGTLHRQHCNMSCSNGASSMRGRLNLEQLALVGHSFGGSTVAAAAAIEPQPHAVIALDPWWPALSPQSPALDRWQTQTPLLVMGSDAWNTPYNEIGDLWCGKDRQSAILDATHCSKDCGGGALLLVVKGSSHDTFSDIPLLFSHLAWLMPKLGFSIKADPALLMAAISSATCQFLHRHLATAQAPQLPSLIHARSSNVVADGFSSGKHKTAAPATTSAAKADMTNSNATDVMQYGGRSQQLPATQQTGDSHANLQQPNDHAGHSCNKGDMRREGGVQVEVPSEATRTMPGIAPGQALDPSGAEVLPGNAASAAPQHLSDKTAGHLNGLQRDKSRAAFGTASDESRKVVVDVTDESDMRALLGDLAAKLELHV